MTATNQKQGNVRRGRLPSLDGWRAVSILLVLASHCTYISNVQLNSYVQDSLRIGGALGVRFFFVISGFLITLLLLREGSAAESISLKQFYWRRAFRILPVYFLFLGTLVILQCLGIWRQSRLAWFGVGTFSFNFFGSGEQWLPGHLWSLAIEEQFYLIWPVLLYVVKPWKNPRLALACLSIPIILCPALRALGAPFPNISIFASNESTFTQADPLAYGCLGAVLIFAYEEKVSSFMERRAFPFLCTGLGLVILPHIIYMLALSHVTWLPHPRIFLLPFEVSVQAAGFLLLLLMSICLPGSHFFRLLNIRPMVWLGTLSYSLYIWQQIFCGKAADYGLSSAWWMSFPGWLLPTFAVAILSYYCLELPFLQIKNRLQTQKVKEAQEQETPTNSDSDVVPLLKSPR